MSEGGAVVIELFPGRRPPRHPTDEALDEFLLASENVQELISEDDELYELSLELQQIMEWAADATAIGSQRPSAALKVIDELQEMICALREVLKRRLVEIAPGRDYGFERTVERQMQKLHKPLTALAREIDS